MALAKQEFFDKAAVHLLTQKTRAWNGMTCSYLAEDGKKCALGIFIPDGHPAQKTTAPISVLFFLYPDLRKIFELEFPGMFSFLEELQSIHDTTPEIDWKNDLIEFAEKWNLSNQVISNH